MQEHIASSNHRPPVVKTRVFLDLISSKWIVCILFELHEGKKRYSELNKSIPDIKQKPLSTTLRKMERDGLITRVVYPVVPPRVEYQLTRLGNEVIAMMDTINQWSEAHYTALKQSRALYDEAKKKPPFWMQPKQSDASVST